MTSTLEKFLDPELRNLCRDGTSLLQNAPEGLSDYSYLVFPFAKAYEGFLKKLFFSLHVISQKDLDNERWRVGRALNPNLELHLRPDESVYDRMLAFCGGTALPDKLWQVWKKGRNRIFHYFPGRSTPVSLLEAKEIDEVIIATMDEALTTCRI